MPTIVTPDTTSLNSQNIEEIKSQLDMNNDIIQSQIDNINTDLGLIAIEQTTQNNTLSNHETRIGNLETSNPEQLRGLTDTNFGLLPDINKNQYTVKYDYTSDKFMLLPDNSGIIDAPIDGLSYVWKDEDWSWPTIQECDDVNIITPLTNQQILAYNTTSSKFENIDIPSSFPEVTTNEEYVWNIGSWEKLTDTQVISDINTDISNLQTQVNNL